MANHGLTQARLRALEAVGGILERLRVLEERMSRLEARIDEIDREVARRPMTDELQRLAERLGGRIDNVASRVEKLVKEAASRKSSGGRKKASEAGDGSGK